MPTIVETRICAQSGKPYEVLQEELDILEKISPVFGWKKYDIPVSKYHPDVNHQWHLSWRNERTLYRGKCDLTGDEMITSMSPDSGYKVYKSTLYRSDKWDPMEYGRDVDLSRSVLEQFGELFKEIPHESLKLVPNMVNCHYCNYGMESKDCYMAISAIRSKNCYYSSLGFNCLFDVDGLNNTVEYGYGCVYVVGCYECFWVVYSHNCKMSSYLIDCNDCSDCFLCTWLSHKQYCILNKQYTKEEYHQKIIRLKEQYTQDQLYQQFRVVASKQPKRATRNVNAENVTGDLNVWVSNCYDSFDIQHMKDGYYMWTCGIQSSDFVRTTLVWLEAARVYNSIGLSRGNVCLAANGNELYQCFCCYDVRNSEFCFGCVGLTHKKYCIFNKQYTKETYEQMMAKIIERMIEDEERGEFFSPAHSLFPYNDSSAYERFPETKEEVLAKWRKRRDKEEKKFIGEAYIPLDIAEYTNNPDLVEKLLTGTIVCEVTQRPFRIIKQELDFYSKFALQIPRKHPDQRYKERIEDRRLPRTLFTRKCEKTWVTILTPYAPERPEKVRSNEARDQEYLG